MDVIDSFRACRLIETDVEDPKYDVEDLVLSHELYWEDTREILEYYPITYDVPFNAAQTGIYVPVEIIVDKTPKNMKEHDYKYIDNDDFVYIADGNCCKVYEVEIIE